MSVLVVTGIGLLVTNDPERGEIERAAVVCEGGRVAWTGPEAELPEQAGSARLDVGGACVVPGFVDAHTHLVFAGDRAEEFAARLAGAPYAAGGIHVTVAATRATSSEQLQANAHRLAAQALASGTTLMEVKSGYGLTVTDERRLLEVAGTLPATVATFLGAHVVPTEYEGRADAYVDLVCGPMLDACAPLARWCDVFCEDGAFDEDQSRAVLKAGAARGLGLRVHANQLARGAGVRLAAEVGAASADHCTYLDVADLTALADAGVVATLLPLAELSTNSQPALARRLLEAGVEIALATDCNPGTSYTTSMPLVIALACLVYRLAPTEALRAATVGGARALRLDDAGHLRVGARADLVVLGASTYIHLAYRPGAPLVHAVIRAGEVVA